jgi:SHS2 domain-containing protein
LGSIELLPHTGDIGMRVRAASLADLFATAAQGLFDILVERPGEPVGLTDSISVREERLDLLLRAWLDELLFRFLVERRLYVAWDVIGADERSVTAAASGVLFDSDRHDLKTELKAVTYHGLEVKRDGEGWVATVIFDV